MPNLSLATDRISPADAARQARTADEILRRLQTQPGVILADEVGMGKTFVALAVAAGVLESTGRKRPVVVMVPPPVADKWPSDWSAFEELCLPAGSKIRATDRTISHGSDFLKLLDDPADRCAHIIFMKHGALRSSLNDPFIKLAVIRQAFLHQRSDGLRRRREAFPRWASVILNDRWFNEERTKRLLDSHPSKWLAQCEDLPLVKDDPVPALFSNTIGRTDLTEIRSALLHLPINDSANRGQKIKSVRNGLKQPLLHVWRSVIKDLEFKLPLLILDEAHHVKNPTQLASLLYYPDTKSEDPNKSDAGLEGALAGKFDRMLFLTATPFQLGHRELIRVISRFRGVRLSEPERRQFDSTVADLGSSLDQSQSHVSLLDTAWGRLTSANASEMDEGWWISPAPDTSDAALQAAHAAQKSVASFTAAQHALKPWVIRHQRNLRRDVISGAGILPDSDVRGQSVSLNGLQVPNDAVVPFLLAARLESMVSLHGLRGNKATSAVFTQGLASSYDAFRNADRDDSEPTGEESKLPREFRWYRKQIELFIPEGDQVVLDSHPKIRATTLRVVDLWKKGEKVLVFCYYRGTGRRLQRSISTAINAEVSRRAKSAGTTVEKMDRRSTNQFAKGSPAAKLVIARVAAIGVTAGLEEDNQLKLGEIVLRFLRDPSFQTRFLDPTVDLITGLQTAFDRSDQSGADLVDRIETFAARVQTLISRERADLWLDLAAIQTGGIGSGQVEDRSGNPRKLLTLPNVRLANGGTHPKTRQRLMRTFNSPFFPEVLIASSVMAEGVDLHTDCRYVIHHDLDWNPSTLEQRNGRLDRIGSLGERTSKQIVVYEPFLAGTQDERMYNVVKDRERWFNIIMGSSIPKSAHELDRMSERIPLPNDLVDKLIFRLGVDSTITPE